jgi:hypothetical protein
VEGALPVVYAQMMERDEFLLEMHKHLEQTP